MFAESLLIWLLIFGFLFGLFFSKFGKKNVTIKINSNMLYTSLNIPAQSSLFLLAAPPPTCPSSTPAFRFQPGSIFFFFFRFEVEVAFWRKLFLRWFIHDRAGFWGSLASPFIWQVYFIAKVACQSYTRPDKCHWYLIKSGLEPGVQKKKTRGYDIPYRICIRVSRVLLYKKIKERLMLYWILFKDLISEVWNYKFKTNCKLLLISKKCCTYCAFVGRGWSEKFNDSQDRLRTIT